MMLGGHFVEKSLDLSIFYAIFSLECLGCRNMMGGIGS